MPAHKNSKPHGSHREPQVDEGHVPVRTVSRPSTPAAGGYFFSQTYNAPPSKPDPSRLRLDQFKDPFDADAMHPSQQDYFRYPHKLREIANDPAKLADFYADVISTAHRDFSSNTSAKTQTGIEMYSASLQDLGFERKRMKDLSTHIEALSGAIKVIVVVGCQSRALLFARANAAAMVFQRFVDAKVDNLQILFSGRHPPEDRVSILNEAAGLKDNFEEGLRAKYRDSYDKLLAAGRIHLETDRKTLARILTSCSQ